MQNSHEEKVDSGVQGETKIDTTEITSHPNTPHPTPYTLHPTPYTLHPTPYTLRGSQAACLERVCVMLVSLYFPVTCNPSRAVTSPNNGVPQYIGVPHRVAYPYPRDWGMNSTVPPTEGGAREPSPCNHVAA